MIHSMTGFGRAEKTAGPWRCRVEIRSVNNRFLEARLRLPAGLAPCEEALRELIRSRCQRGKIDCTIQLVPDQEPSQAVQLNLPLARGYARLVEEFRRAFGLEVQVTLRDLMEIKELIDAEAWQADPGPLESLAREALAAALDGLIEMRLAEGRATQGELLRMIGELRRLQEQIRPLARDLPIQFAQRLRENLARLMEGGVPQEERVLQEIAILADRCDISEEMVRFTAHLDAGEKILAGEGAIGRKFEFLLQEMNREANTLASKCNHAGIAARVIEIKGVLEQMREQIQNIE